MINKLWTILSGSPDEPVFGDWRRLTETSGIRVSADNSFKIKRILGDTDPHIRGYVVEGVLQAALQSSYAPSLKEYDKLNTYNNPIAIRRQDTVVYTNSNEPIRAVVSKNSDNPSIYRLHGSIIKSSQNTLSVDVNDKVTELPLTTFIPLNEHTSIILPSADVFKNDISFDIYQLPTASPLTIFSARLHKFYPVYITNAPAHEAAGKFITDLLK